MRKTTRLLLLSAVFCSGLSPLAGFAAPGGKAHWDYDGREGPSRWASLDKDYATCGVGKLQSPIDITGAQAAPLPPIAFDYQPAPLTLVNNGHTVQANYPSGSAITVGKHTYALVQFHFHTPSEEQVEGRAYDMVWHLVHKDRDGKLAVVGVLVKEGRMNPAIDKITKNLPKKTNQEVRTKTPLNASALLPAQKAYYHFMGSLTTPPCSEGVSWYVMKQPIEASAAQIAAFRSLFGANARPVQPRNGRALQMSH